MINRIYMDRRQLQIFAAAVEEGVINAAARRLHLSQPAVSAAIRNLEDSLGVLLLDRHRSGVKPTVFGSALYDHAQRIDQDFSRALEAIESIKDPSKGSLAIGLGQTVSLALVSNVVNSVHEEYPGLNIRVATGLYRHFHEPLGRGELDLVISQLPVEADRSPEFEYTWLFDDPILVVAGSNHPLANKKMISGGELTEYQWVAVDHPDLGTLWLQQFFEKNGLTPPDPFLTGNALALVKTLLMD